MITRRRLLSGIAGGAAAAAASPQAALAATTVRMKLTTSWSPKMPILQDAAEHFAAEVQEASGSALRIKVYAGGELIPPLGVFDAVSSGSIEMGMSAAYYWSGKINAAPFFSAIPFGLTAQQFNAWLVGGGGQKLWEELYADYHLVPMPLGNTGIQMAGWFKHELKSAEDLKGLKMRIPGIGGEVMARAGANVVLMPGGELYTALERGTIDATEWVSPFHDERLGLFRAAKYYYYPGWQEPSSNLELIVHDKAWASLSKELQAIVRAAAAKTSAWMLSKSEAENGPALKRLVEDHGVQLRELPQDILAALKRYSDEVVGELAEKDAFSKKVYASYESFRKEIKRWSAVGEDAYVKALG